MSFLLFVLFLAFQCITGSRYCGEGKDIKETNSGIQYELNLPDIDDIIIAFKTIATRRSHTEIYLTLTPSTEDRPGYNPVVWAFIPNDSWRSIKMYKNRFSTSDGKRPIDLNGKVPLTGRKFKISSNGPVCWHMFTPYDSTELEMMGVLTSERPGDVHTEILRNVPSCKTEQHIGQLNLSSMILLAVVCGLLGLSFALTWYIYHLRKKERPTTTGVPLNRSNVDHDFRNSLYDVPLR